MFHVNYQKDFRLTSVTVLMQHQIMLKINIIFQVFEVSRQTSLLVVFNLNMIWGNSQEPVDIWMILLHVRLLFIYTRFIKSKGKGGRGKKSAEATLLYRQIKTVSYLIGVTVPAMPCIPNPRGLKNKCALVQQTVDSAVVYGNTTCPSNNVTENFSLLISNVCCSEAMLLTCHRNRNP